MKTEYDVIVVGVGSMGSASCYHLASRGLSVLGLDQFNSPHDQGSHAGQSRIIRKAYFEHPDYVPLLEKAYSNWRDVESKTDKQIYFSTGLLYAGKPDQVLIKGVHESANKYNINIESLSASEAKLKFPRFAIPSDYEILFEPDAGFVTPERAIATYIELAKKSSAEIHSNEKVISWNRVGVNTIKVATDKSLYTCKKIIFTAGAWTEKLIPSLKKSLNVTRQVIVWVNPKDNSAFELGQFPCWMIDDEHEPGMYYGFPALDTEKFGNPAGLKLGYHYPGLLSDADKVNRTPEVEEETRLINALEKYLPNTYSSTNVLKTCLYTNTPDENFIIDFLPGYKDVIIGAGFSGHGFKFVSAIGEILSDLAIDESTALPIAFLNATRFTG